MFFYLFTLIFWPCCMACRILALWPGFKPLPSALAAWSLNHWITKEVSEVKYFLIELCILVSQVARVVNNLPANVGDKKHGFDPWVGKIPWRKTWEPTPVFLPGESHGQGSLMSYVPWGCKESDITEVQHTARIGFGHNAFAHLIV